MNFPTLSSTPSLSAWEETRAQDPTIRSQKEGGYISTRPRFTRAPKKWKIAYQGGNALSAADKATLQTFEGSVNVGAAMFVWTNPTNSTAYNVRLAGPIIFKPTTSTIYWEASFDLEQV